VNTSPESTVQSIRFCLESVIVYCPYLIGFIHVSGGIPCEICSQEGKTNKTFSDYNRISIHLERHKKKRIPCDVCGKPILETMFDDIKWHKWCHKNEEEQREAIAAGAKPVKPPQNRNKKPTEDIHLCPQCGKSFSSLRGLEHHSETHLPKEERDKKRIACPECGKWYLPRHLNNHIKVNHRGIVTIKRHSCPYPECSNREFFSSGVLNRHVRQVHLHEKPFVCETCGKGFAAKTSFQNHLSSHSDSKNFHCELCSSAFKYPNNLKRHKKKYHKGYLDPVDVNLIE
jgi:KRAB domain-containing zinc finger protein